MGYDFIKILPNNIYQSKWKLLKRESMSVKRLEAATSVVYCDDYTKRFDRGIGHFKDL